MSTLEQAPIDSLSRTGLDAPHKQSVLMHPVIFVALFTLVGILFALQEWVHISDSGFAIDPITVFAGWALQYFLWGVTAWALWRLFRPFIQDANVVQMLTIVFPLSLAICLIEQMIWVVFFPGFPIETYGDALLAAGLGNL